MGWPLLPNALRPFQDLSCSPEFSPNLGIIKKWKCRLNFAQRPIFSCSRFFNEPEISESGPPPGGLVLRIFTSWKNPSTSARFQPVNLGFWGEHVTPRPPRWTDSSICTVLSRKVTFIRHIIELDENVLVGQRVEKEEIRKLGSIVEEWIGKNSYGWFMGVLIDHKWKVINFVLL